MQKALNVQCPSSESIGLNEVGGLWIILTFAVVISVIIHLLKRINKSCAPLKTYRPPYYTYNNQKTEIFEAQLKQAVNFELNSKFSDMSFG